MPEDQAKTIRIVKLDVENFKRIRAVSITPSGSVVQITGRNDQGKSSLIDSIAAALGGGRQSVDRPIRRGQKQAEAVLDLGDIVVRKKWTQAGESLLITAKDGSKLATPQAILDRLKGDLTFDPLSFVRMPFKDQAMVLRRVAGLENAFDDIDRRKTKAAEERLETGRLVKRLESQLQNLPAAPPSVLPSDGTEDEVSVTDLARDLSDAGDAVRASQITRDSLEHAAMAVRSQDNAVQEARAKLRDAEGTLARYEQVRKERAAAVDALPPDPDTRAIANRLAGAEESNRGARARRAARLAREKADQERATVVAAWDGARAEHAKQDKLVASIEAEKEAAIAAAKFPVEGLAIDEENSLVLLNGIPLSQAGRSSQMRTSVAIGMAQNPRLRVMLVHGGEALDTEALADLERIAEEFNAQIWLERVTDGQQVGVVIEDGEVKEPELRMNGTARDDDQPDADRPHVDADGEPVRS